ncbi:DUF1173 family protein [Massilia sp. TS11]|uniref:DUF1173 family protein n=1 Tax=Massilia sp. TS11 TaxID=2908003 RepID=UPI001EDB70A3|nr:DUF1173 family protein [Massilia sp. TS11]MCG2583842.1 DUF1173 domain-containing protein [Massilia sp. TS11]
MEEQQTYLIADRLIERSDTALQSALAACHRSAARPRCMCVPGGVEMYVARYHRFVVKCMPGTGALHHPRCIAYEPEPDVSGAGALVGTAMREGPDGLVDVSVRFALARQPGRSRPSAAASDRPDVVAGAQPMSLTAFLHLLMERAALQRWHPAMAGKRSYSLFQRYLLDAACEIRMKGVLLRDLLFVPEPYYPEHKVAIAARRNRRLSRLTVREDGRIPMLPIIGELKAIEQGATNRLVWLKHMPDLPLLIGAQVWERLARKHRELIDTMDAVAQTRVVLAAIVWARSERELHVDTMTLMLTSKVWMPLAGSHELGLHDALVRAGRRFLKPLRYDAKSWGAFANFLLLDAGPRPLPLHVLDPWAELRDQQEKQAAIDKDEGCWRWRLDHAMPALPPVATIGDDN